MSFHRTGLGDVVSDVADVITGVRNVKSAVGPALEIVKDPYFPKVIGMIAELHALEQPSDGSSVPGVGLRHLVPPLAGYVAYRRNPWIIGPLVVMAVVGLPFLLGYTFGKGARR